MILTLSSLEWAQWQVKAVVISDCQTRNKRNRPERLCCSEHKWDTSLIGTEQPFIYMLMNITQAARSLRGGNLTVKCQEKNIFIPCYYAAQSTFKLRYMAEYSSLFSMFVGEVKVGFSWLVVRQWRLNLPTNIPLHVVAVQQMAAEGQSDRMASDVGSACEAKVWHWILPWGKNGTHWCLPNTYGDQTVDVSAVRWWCCVSAVVTVMWERSHFPDNHADYYEQSI